MRTSPQTPQTFTIKILVCGFNSNKFIILKQIQTLVRFFLVTFQKGTIERMSLIFLINFDYRYFLLYTYIKLIINL